MQYAVVNDGRMWCLMTGVLEVTCNFVVKMATSVAVEAKISADFFEM
jgi:hypothetical protein